MELMWSFSLFFGLFELKFLFFFVLFHFLQILSHKLKSAFIVTTLLNKYMMVFLSCRFYLVRLLICFSSEITVLFSWSEITISVLLSWVIDWDFSFSDAILELTSRESERGSSTSIYFYCDVMRYFALSYFALRLWEMLEFYLSFYEAGILLSRFVCYLLRC